MTTYERALKKIASIVKSNNNKPLPKEDYEKDFFTNDIWEDWYKGGLIDEKDDILDYCLKNHSRSELLEYILNSGVVDKNS
tara:strand:- start:199 stop:441 length:243 start_codon:yes stop_codon:yes gene_type:complete